MKPTPDSPPRGLGITSAVLCLSVLFAFAGWAQNADEPTTKAPAEQSKAEVEAKLAKLAEDDSIEAPVKDALTAKYEETIAELEAVATNRQATEAFREAVQLAPEETKRLKGDLEALVPLADAAKNVSISDEANPQKDIETRRAEIAELKSQLVSTEGDLKGLQARPEAIGARLPKAKAELVEIEAALEAADPAAELSPVELAEQDLQKAKRARLVSEIEMLDQEQLSQGVREARLIALRDFLRRKVENGEAALDALEKLVEQKLLTDADRLKDRLEEILSAEAEDAITGTDAGRAFVDDLRSLADELRTVIEKIGETNDAHDSITGKLDELETEFARIAREVELGGLQGTFAEVVVQQRRQLPNARLFAGVLKERREALRELRLDSARVDNRIENQQSLEQKFADGPQRFAELLALRKEFLAKLQADYGSLIREVARLDSVERAYHDKVITVRSYLDEKMLWIRSSPPVGSGTGANLGAAVDWLLFSGRGRELGSAIKGVFVRYPVRGIVVLLVVVALLVARPWLVKMIRETGIQTRRISTDRYIHTAKAFLGTVLLAIPASLAIGFIGWGLWRDPDGSEWLRGVSRGVNSSAWILFAAWFIGAACRRDGLLAAHFGRDDSGTVRVRHAIFTVFAVYLPTYVAINSMAYEDSSQYFDSLGRLCFALSHIWFAIVLARLLSPRSGIFAETIREYPKRSLARFCWIWYIAVVGIPLVLVLVAGIGYFFTALALSDVFLATLGLIALGVLLYSMLLRWFMIEERKLALAQALEKRRKRREADTREGEEEGSEEITADDAEKELDLASVAQQIRRLLRSLTCVGVAVGLWLFWSAALRFDAALGNVTLLGGIPVLGLFKAILIIAAVLTIARNLPGILELSGLRDNAEPGTRYAIATLCQYAVITIGLFMLFNVLGVDWSKFGWIATGLSVGIGFGMQEVVANFVCGIILLFERPLRVGDVVTIGDVTGTVTKIRMRATTITNWDRKEFVVPNKQFVTGTLMNWTLSSSVNRIVINIGVAYGCDTDKALEILRDVAHDHPRIMDDPAPLVTFDTFGDSALNFILRCYLPELDGRAGVISELNSEIHRRLNAAGIEIPFPQHDLHVRSVDAPLIDGSAKTPEK